jgi:hypothetical protein
MWPDDDDVASLLAESIMILHCDSFGYHFYDSTGTALPEIATAITLLELAMKRSGHPFAMHLYIHVTEGSTPGYGPNSAGRAEVAADR